MQLRALVNRRTLVALAVVGVSFLLALAYARPYGASNQQTYLIDPLHRAHPELFNHDWLVASTTAYHPVFGWLAAPLFGLDPTGVRSFAIAQLVVMTLTYVALYGLIAALVTRGRLAVFLALAGLLALGGGRTLAGTYLFAGYLQPSSLATLLWLIALRAWVRDRPLAAGVWLGLGGACHVNFLVLGLGLFGLLELMSVRLHLRELSLRRVAAVLGPSLVVLAAFAPTLLAGGHAHDPATALRLLMEFCAPGHYAPSRIRHGQPPLIAWLVVAWGVLPVARAAGGAAIDRMWRFAVAATVVCVAATLLVSIPPLLRLTQLFVWRIAPFAQLASQLIVIAAVLAPGEAPLAVPGVRRRAIAVVGGGLVLIVEAVRLNAELEPVVGLGLLVAIGLVALWRRGRVTALVLAVAMIGAALGSQWSWLIEPPAFEPQCGGSDCELLRKISLETPVDSVFLVPPYMNWFRLFGRRGIVADTKSPPLYPDELVAWYRRLCAIVGAPEVARHEQVEAMWDTLSADQLLAAAHQFDVDYIFLYKQLSRARLPLPIAYETADHLVYRVR